MPTDPYKFDKSLLPQQFLYPSKPLSPLEKAKVIRRLEDCGMTRFEIAKRIGKTQAYISDAINLDKAPSYLKEVINNGNIAATEVNRILRKAESDEEAIKIVQKAVELANKAGKKKATRKIINQAEFYCKSQQHPKYVLKPELDESSIQSALEQLLEIAVIEDFEGKSVFKVPTWFWKQNIMPLVREDIEK